MARSTGRQSADKAFYIGYDTAAKTWKGYLSSAVTAKIAVRAATTKPISTLTPVGFSAGPFPALSPVFLVYDKATNRYVDKTAAAGLGKAILGRLVAAGDFNNDGFVDLFITCNDELAKRPNILYLNKGDGTFVEAAGAAGAAGGTVGPHNTTTNLELGSKVAVADFNQDGFLDIFTGNTLWKSISKEQAYLAASNRLYRNEKNANHWLEIDLVGTRSNRDAIGARVVLKAGGKSQLREQGGGMHLFAQDHKRLHFGLGAAATVESVVVEWPSGVRQELKNLKVDQILKITEPQ
ncbi:CRTAC1 family protein [Gloeobacter morelensis]|uniref:CRTAC1 family protein n=1 Tax=Gloeobacter morelensis MG652769 TaxID=2781736 RepID=A0ABY3PGF0_9CYAN|nr:CRTAC1 family protein [Gloeobacter morelensis]UFP92691.1 CRTAC1 family protein [Gloeobacter morelensis MG652769]